MPANDDPGATPPLPLQRPQQPELGTTIVFSKPPDPGQGNAPAQGANPDASEPYVFGREIARGGMGSILEAQDCKLSRTVAVKIILSKINADDVQKQRFINEAAVLAKLAHPNIVPVYDIGRDDAGQLYYSMKLVKGRTLQAIINDLHDGVADTAKQYTLAHLLTIFRKVCDAMAFVHSKGIIHRDLKPENVMVGEFGEVLVMDWGLAKMLDGSADTPVRNATSSSGEESPRSLGSTRDGDVMGTPQYMSPEQADGRTTELDARSDIFSLGGILYSILTLRPPVEGKTLDELLKKVTSGDITPLGTVGQARRLPSNGKPTDNTAGGAPALQRPIPPALAAVTMKALALDKTKRYQSVTKFSADIEKYQNGFATQAEHASLMKQIILLIRRNKGVFATAAAALLLISVLGVWFVISIKASERETRRQAEIALENEKKAVASEAEAKAEAQRATKAEAEAVKNGEATRHALAKSALALAEAARREGNGPEMQAALGAVPEDLRDSTWHYLLDQSDSSIARIRSTGGQIDSVAADPRHPGVFAIADGGTVILLEVRTGVHLLEFKPVFPPKSAGQLKLAFSPDGERIAVGRQDGDCRILIHSARDGTKLLEWEAPGTFLLEFSPDGRLLLQVQRSAKLLTVWDAATGQLRWKYEPVGTVNVGIFTPDSQQVVTHSNQDHIRLVNAQDGTLVRPLGGDNVFACAIRPDGKMLVTGGGTDGRIKGVYLQDGKVAFEVRAQNGSFKFIAFTPDGARFVTVTDLTDGRQAIELRDANTGALLQSLLGGSGQIYGAAVHPLSGELLVASPSPRAWNLTGTPEKWTLRASSEQIAFWGSDDVVFSAAPSQNSVLQKLQAGTPELLWKSADFHYGRVSVSADGRVAAMGYKGGDPGAHDLFLLRNPGAHTEQAAAFKHSGELAMLRLSPTGDRLAAIPPYYHQVDLYDTTTGQQLVKLERKDMKVFWDLGWLRGGQQLVALATAKVLRGNPGSEERIVLWDAATGKIVQTATNRTAMNVLAVAPDGRRFAEAGADKMVRIRDAATLAVQQEFRAHDGPITALAWHPTKPIVATASADLSVKIWNVETGRRLEELRGMVAAPTALAFSPSGQRLGCAGVGNLTRIWEPPSLNDQPTAAQPADGWEDLLTPLTPAAVMQTGNGWRLENGALFSPDKAFATLPLPGNLSGTSYQVRVKLRQLAIKSPFHLALPVADQMVGFDLDRFLQGSFYTGLIRVDGKEGISLPSALHGKQVKDSEQHDLEVGVRLDGVNATITTNLDGQPLYEWTGPSTALSQHENWTTPPGTLALGAKNTDWVVYEVKVKRLEK